jgi:capsule polysaccharide export protein KpsE/RkpR
MKSENDIRDPQWWLWALLKKWRLLVFLPVIIGILGFGVAHFIMPKWFKAEAEIMPMYRSGDLGGTFANLVTGMMGFGGGGGDYVLPMMTTPSDLWGAIIKSNAIVDTLINEYDLKKRYKKEYIEETRKILRKHIITKVSGEGILTIGFEDKDPIFATKVANSIVEHLDRINRNLKTGTAAETRVFIEKRLEETSAALAQAESSFAAFQKKHGAISIEDQTKVAIEGIAQVRAELLMAEVELGIAKSSRTSEHREVEEIQSRIDELRKQLKKLESGEGSSEPFALMDIPDLGIEYARLFRELQIQGILFEFLTQQYEQARIEEKRDLPILQILSRAEVPEKRDRPKRIIISALSLFSALILVGLWIVGSAGLDRLKELKPETYQRLANALGDKKKRNKE